MSHHRRPAGRAARALAALLLSLGLVGFVAGCGEDAQLLKPYNPADGTNLDVGDGPQSLKIRNLLVVSSTKGEGYLSASLVSSTADELTSATVAPQTLAGTNAAAVPATFPAPVKLAPGALVVLTDQPFITVRAPDIQAGGQATVVMQFAKAGAVTLNCPIADGTQAPWSTVSPSPAPSGDSASPSPSPSATS